MNVLRATGMAFALYSRIPMPPLDWESGARRYTLYAFPLVGLAVGGGLLLWTWLAGALGLGQLLWAAGMTAIPLLITGGIHLDGFCDVCDALASHQSRERKLEIMADPHVGAFAVQGCGLLLLLTFGHKAGNNHTLTVYAVLADGSKWYYAYDVTDQIHSAPDPRNVHIVLDGLPLPKPIVNGGGFQPEVEDWQTVPIDIEM